MDLFSAALSVGSSLLGARSSRKNARQQNTNSQRSSEIYEELFNQFKDTYPQAHEKYTNYVLSGGDDPNKEADRAANAIDSDFTQRLGQLEKRLMSRGIDPSSPKFQSMSKNLLPQLAALKAKTSNDAARSVQQNNVNRLQSLSDNTFNRGATALNAGNQSSQASARAAQSQGSFQSSLGGIASSIYDVFKDSNTTGSGGVLGSIFGR